MIDKDPCARASLAKTRSGCPRSGDRPGESAEGSTEIQARSLWNLSGTSRLPLYGSHAPKSLSLLVSALGLEPRTS